MQSGIDSSNQKQNENTCLSLEKKLSTLMLRGWVLLADVCPFDKCQCPLMRSPDLKMYCCNCEAWIVNNQLDSQQSFNEIAPSTKINVLASKRQNNAKGKHIEIIEVPKEEKPIESKELVNSTNIPIKEEIPIISSTTSNLNTVMQIHQNKLDFLSEKLAKETDPENTKILLKSINLCIKNMKELSLIFK